MVRCGVCAFTPAFIVVIAWFVAVLWISSLNAGAEEAITAQLLRQQRTFLEPLVSSGKSTESDDEDLQKALTAFRARGQTDDYSALENFANKHPNSKWLASLHYNLGRECYNSGYYSKALNNWAKAWEMLKSSSDPQCKMLADRAGGELAMMLARVGRMDELSKLLKEFENRAVVGSATERISGARQGLWTMQNRPEIAFRCGPLALDRICAAKYPELHGHKLIQYSTSTTNGFALDKLAALSAELEMNYQMAYRSPGSPFIVPSVVHWKVWHYAALIEKTENGRYHLQDPTFGNDVWVTQQALEEETTGYFMVAQGDLPEGWRPVSGEEGKTIFGSPKWAERKTS